MFAVSSGFARLFAEQLCFSVSFRRLIAAMPPSGGTASKIGEAVQMKPSFIENRVAKAAICLKRNNLVSLSL
jgi:hypothetical protein